MRINEIIEKTVYTKPGEDPAGRSKYLSTYDIGVMDKGLEKGENTRIKYKGTAPDIYKKKVGRPLSNILIFIPMIKILDFMVQE